jgi:hypothetical protein
MKNLLIITEEEKNRILGLHESATKNHYLINEQWVVVDNQSQTLTLNNYLEIEDSRNLVGALELKLNKGVTFVRFSSDRLIAKNTPYQKVGDATGIVKTEGTNDIFYWCATKLFQVKGETEKYIGENFSTFVKKSFDQLCESIKVQASPEDVQAGVLKNAQACGWGNDVEGYKNSGWACPKPGSGNKVDGNKGTNVKNTQTQESPNVTRIKNLQTKVGLKNTGSLDQSTLKAIMDKLSQ